MAVVAATVAEVVFFNFQELSYGFSCSGKTIAITVTTISAVINNYFV